MAAAPDISEMLTALDQCPDDVVAGPVAGPRLPELKMEPHFYAARTWCLCDACVKVRANIAMPDLLHAKVTDRWRLYHTAWWEGITPEIRALAAASEVAIPPALENHTPMDLPAPFL